MTGFSVSKCAAAVGNQRSSSPAVRKTRSPRTIPDGRGSKPRVQDVRRMAASQEAVQQQAAEKLTSFVALSQHDTRMLSCSRADQLIAIRMLLEESRRFQKRKTQCASNDNSSNNKKLIPRSSTRPPFEFKDLLTDVHVLMLSDVWNQTPKPGTPPHERHPYLFTLSEVHKLGLFNQH